MEPRAPRRFVGLRRIARTAIRVDAAVTDVLDVGVVSTAVFVLYVLIFVPVGFVVLLACVLVGFAISLPFTSSLAGAFVLGGFGVGLALDLFVFVKLYRRLPRQVRDLALDPEALIPIDDEDEAGTAAPAPSVPGPTLPLAEIDARLAVKPAAAPSKPAGSNA